MIHKCCSMHTTFTEACRDSSDYLLCPINLSLKGYRKLNILIIFILSFVFLHVLSSILNFHFVMGSVFIYIIKFIIKINTVIKLAHK